MAQSEDALVAYMSHLRNQLRTYFLTSNIREQKNKNFEVFLAIMGTYAKQNNMNELDVFDHIFKELSKPVEVSKLRDLAKQMANEKEKQTQVTEDEEKYPNIAFLQQLNHQVISMLGLKSVEEDIMTRARDQLYVPHLQGGFPMPTSA